MLTHSVNYFVLTYNDVGDDFVNICKIFGVEGKSVWKMLFYRKIYFACLWLLWLLISNHSIHIPALFAAEFLVDLQGEKSAWLNTSFTDFVELCFNFSTTNVNFGCCIVQWLFLVRLFDDVSMCRRLELHREEFLAVHTKFVVRIVPAFVARCLRH